MFNYGLNRTEYDILCLCVSPLSQIRFVNIRCTLVGVSCLSHFSCWEHTEGKALLAFKWPSSTLSREGCHLGSTQPSDLHSKPEHKTPSCAPEYSRHGDEGEKRGDWNTCPISHFRKVPGSSCCLCFRESFSDSSCPPFGGVRCGGQKVLQVSSVFH